MFANLSVFLGALAIVMVATPLLIQLALRRGLVDVPDPRKVHKAPIPRIGGIAIVIGVLASTVPVLLLDQSMTSQRRTQMVVLLLCSFFMAVVGVIDDVRGMRARVKLLAQLCAALLVCAAGIRIQSFSAPDWYHIQLGWWSWPLTVLWILTITNAVNLIDGLDGLSAGVSLIACATVAIFACWSGQAIMSLLMIAVIGGLLGFLFYNFNPAKVFMGDGGTMFLGFLLASSSVLCSRKAATLVGLALPALALGVPILDTMLSIVRRILERRSVFAPDRGHIHHRLLSMGFAHHDAVLVIYLLTAFSASVGMFMLVVHSGLAILEICILVALVLVVAFRVVGAVRFRQSLQTIKHNLQVMRQAKKVNADCQYFELRLRESSSLEAWWQTVCLVADRIGFDRLSVRLFEEQACLCQMEWRGPSRLLLAAECVDVVLPVSRRDSRRRLELVATLPARDGVESLGRHVMHFGRLLDNCTGLKCFDSEVLPAQASVGAGVASSLDDRQVA